MSLTALGGKARRVPIEAPPPPTMVDALRHLLRQMGLAGGQIKVDAFAGLG